MYINLTEANEYFSTRLHADAWAEAADADKEKALAMATKAIDRQLLRGRKTDTSQAMAFPRYPDTEESERQNCRLPGDLGEGELNEDPRRG